jgi:hypothetical protein
MTKREFDKLRKFCLTHNVEVYGQKDHYDNYTACLTKAAAPRIYTFRQFEPAMKQAKWLARLLGWDGSQHIFRS